MRTQLLFALVVLCNFASNNSPAATVTSVTCSTPTVALQSRDASCLAQGLYGYSSSSVSTSISLPLSLTQGASIESELSVAALQYGVHGLYSTATAQATSDIGIVFDTEGPVRSGLLEVFFNQGAAQMPANGYFSQLLQVGSFAADTNGISPIWIPIQLGSEFGFDYTQTLTAIGSSGSGLTQGKITSDISLFAFEADGTTSVQLFDPPGSPTALLNAPEPASIGFAALGILALSLVPFLPAVKSWLSDCPRFHPLPAIPPGGEPIPTAGRRPSAHLCPHGLPHH